MADASEQRFRQLIGGRRNPNTDPILRAEKRGVESGPAGKGSGKRVEVEPSGEAQRLVEGWLRLGGSRNAGAQGREEEEGEEDEAVPWNPEARPARLGLGAKFLPHSHVAASMLSVERRLRDKLNVGRGVGDSFASGSADARPQFGGGGSRSSIWSKPHSGGSRSVAGRPMARGREGKGEQPTSRRRTDERKGGGEEDEDEDEEEEEEEEDMEGSRASVFAKKAKFQAIMDVSMDVAVGAKKGNKKKKKKQC
ncbi:hypothetical protein CBR_g32062 [Chara braunii]|uniref:Uncharacterized protein n=1 Tax=Chara braunii TaxID=69332 RepID=A0A388LGF6_CHABU|nr:hypothetical protein CBR_g32062 [Chara braunii]|eukprot:GBG81388.1 hypothetical protein CBR_g32062 [Chara braunii]